MSLALSCLPLKGGYSLMLNRQAASSQGRVQAIEQCSVEGSDGQARRLLYPVDPLSGGTWVGVNDAGTAFALISQPSAQRWGHWVPEALKAKGAGGGLERVAGLDLSSSPPFQLLGLDAGQAPLSLIWDGKQLQRRLHPQGDLLLGLEAAPEPVPAEADEAQVLAAQEAYHLALMPKSHSLTHVLVLPRLVVLRFWDRISYENGQEAEMVQIRRDAEPGQ